MLDQVDEMIIGGGMAFTFLKVLKNMEVRNANLKRVSDILYMQRCKCLRFRLGVYGLLRRSETHPKTALFLQKREPK